MTTIKRFAFSLMAAAVISLAAHAQAPQMSSVNVTPDEQKVRIAAVGDVLDMRVSVSDEAGDIVFDGGPVSGAELDWALVDPQGRRVPPGTYALSVTYRTSSGKLKRRVEQVLVTEEVTGTASAAAEDPTPQAVGTITGQGTTGRISKFTGTNSIGNSILFENAGRIGLGTTAPAQSLHVLGAASALRLQSTGGASLTTTDYAGNGRVWQAGVGGSTAAGGVANKFFVRDLSANQYRLAIDTAGNVGIGTTTPTSRLTVSGMIQILGPTTNGIKFADGSIQTKAIAGTINGTGTTNRLAKFTGPNSFGNSSVTEVSGRVGIGTASPVTALDVRGSLTLEAGGDPELYTSIVGSEQNRYLSLLNSLTVRSASGLKAGGILVSDSYTYAYPDKNDLIVKGRVGVGTPILSARLQVEAGSSGSAIVGSTTGLGTGVSGVSVYGDGVRGGSSSSDLNNTFAGVFGFNQTGGWAGYFQGPVRVTGGCNGCTIAPSDHALKANVSTLDPRSVLDKLAALPIRTWNYRSDSPSVRHLGPVAQDFKEAFNLGADDKHIDMIDANGVTMASVQALYQLMQEKDRQNQELISAVREQGQQIGLLRAQLQRQQSQLNQVRRAVRRKRGAQR